MRGLWWRTLARINHRGMIDESCCVEEGLGARLGTPTDLMMVRSSTTVPAEHGACARGLDEKSANKQYRHLEYNTWLNKGVIHKGNWLVNKLLRIVDQSFPQVISQPTTWHGLCTKAKGHTLRNTMVQLKVHPMATVNENQAKRRGSRVFSKLDANTGFWQILLDQRQGS